MWLDVCSFVRRLHIYKGEQDSIPTYYMLQVQVLITLMATTLESSKKQVTTTWGHLRNTNDTRTVRTTEDLKGHYYTGVKNNNKS